MGSVRSPSRLALAAAAVLAVVACAVLVPLAPAGADAPSPHAAGVVATRYDPVPGTTFVIITSLLVDPSRTDPAVALNDSAPEGVATAQFAIWRKWDTADLPVHVSVDDDGAPEGLHLAAIVPPALSTWSGVPGQSFRYVYDGETVAKPAACGDELGDGVNTIGWADLPDGILARTCAIADTRQVGPYTRIAEADMQFSTAPGLWSAADVTPPDRYDIRSTLLHETGHLLGLDHTPDQGAVMYYQLAMGQQKRALQPDDIAAVRSLYPPVDLAVQARALAIAVDR